MVKFDMTVNVTFSKLLAIVILILGVIFSFVSGSTEVFIFTISLSAGLSGLKSWSNGLTQRRKLDRWEHHQYIDEYRERPYDEIG